MHAYSSSPPPRPRQPQPSARRKSRPYRSSLPKVRPIHIFVFGISIIGALLLYLVSLKSMLGVPSAGLPTVYEVGKGIAFFDRNNKYIRTVYADRERQPVPLSKVSRAMIEAIISAEDRNFYQHKGADPIGIARALLANMQAGRVVQGGSTITQQLARNLYLDQDRSLIRKVNETMLAIDIETHNSKERILETYLNEVYFGNGVYGIERAALTYFNKHASQLTHAEGAFLAGLVKAPSDLGAPVNRKDAIERQQLVIGKLQEYGYVTPQEAATARKQKLKFRSRTVPPEKFPYYIAYVLRLLHNQLGEEKMWSQGLRVYTTLDTAAQIAAEKTLAAGVRTAPRGVNQGALVSISVADGSVLALVGGVGNYKNAQWNRAVNPHTAGSAIKPFVYLAGLMAGVLKSGDVLLDEPYTVNYPFAPSYSPKNFDGRFMGPVTVRDALVFSRNVCSVRIAHQLGIERVIDTAQAAGVKSKIEPHLAVSLGSCALTPLEMANAYATIARFGTYMPERFIRKISDANGQDLFESVSESTQVFPLQPVLQLVDVMQDVVLRGTGKQAKLADVAVAGKTGTADQARDIWFVGFTPDTVTAVWAGNEHNRSIQGSHVTGGAVMAAIWRKYMESFYTSHPKPTIGFPQPMEPLRHEAPLAIRATPPVGAQEETDAEAERFFEQDSQMQNQPTQEDSRLFIEESNSNGNGEPLPLPPESPAEETQTSSQQSAPQQPYASPLNSNAVREYPNQNPTQYQQPLYQPQPQPQSPAVPQTYQQPQQSEIQAAPPRPPIEPSSDSQ